MVSRDAFFAVHRDPPRTIPGVNVTPDLGPVGTGMMDATSKVGVAVCALERHDAAQDDEPKQPSAHDHLHG
jgi:hypothetical protein